MNKELAAEIAGKMLACLDTLQAEANALAVAHSEFVCRMADMMEQAAENVRLVGGVDREMLERAVQEFLPDVMARHYPDNQCDYDCEECDAA
jgi:hypothetical protein